MNKQKIMYVFLIVFLLFNPFNIYSKEVTYYENQVKGDLSCPNGVASANCKMYDKFGKELFEASTDVWRVVTITNSHNEDNVKVSKIVSKTDNTLGKYEVKFQLEGANLNIFKEKKPAYIIIVRDASMSLSEGKLTASRKAITDFVNNLSNQSGANYHFALIQFGENLAVSSKNETFHKNGLASNVYFCKRNDKDNRCKQGDDSRVDKALKKAYDLFRNNAPKDEMKYLIIVGDGRYWLKQDMSGTSQAFRTLVMPQIDSIKTIRKNNSQLLKIIGVYYPVYKNDKTDYNVYYPKGTRICDGDRTSYSDCDKICMTKMVDSGQLYTASNDTAWSTIFEKLGGDLTQSFSNNNIGASGTLTDKMGEYFLTEYLGSQKIVNFNPIGTDIYESETFYIDIDPSAPKGWHETNNGYELVYKSSEKEYKINSNINPEVYWEPSLKELTCSGETTSDNTFSVSNEYFSIICNEGYNENGKYVKGFSTSILINNDPSSFTSFTNKTGFSTKINISTNVKCKYEFNIDAFNNNYNSLNNLYESAVDEVEKYDYYVNLLELKNRLNGYKNDQLLLYQNNFLELKPIMTVTDNENLLDFVNDGEPSIEYNCQDIVKSTILNEEIDVSKLCYLKMSKTMVLPNACIDMTSAKQSECEIDSNKQLNGGNKYYPDYNTTSGKLQIEINNITYSGGESVKDNCEYTNQKSKYIYRQINVSDPFLQSTAFRSINTRKIGKNYSSTKYNFVEIIDSTIWNKDPEYVYQLSKTNVDNIRKDSSETGVNSYLGTNCYINSNANEYICPFTRNISEIEGNSKEFFTNVKLP